MKTCSVVVLLLCLALPLQAAEVTKTPGAHHRGTVAGSVQERAIPHSNAAIVCFYDGLTFEDLSGDYAWALAANGLTSDIYQDPTWDCYSGYPLVVVSTSDNWWYASAYDAAFPLMASYMDDGGRMILVGQDFLYGAGIDGYTFASLYLGMAGANEDVLTGDWTMHWYGTPDGPLGGLSGSMAPCFSSNYWYTDEILPTAVGVADWTDQPLLADIPFFEGGSASAHGIFSTVEFACGGNLDEVIGACIDWLEPGFDEITVYPDGSGFFPTIQDAMDAVSEGGTIWLADGIFSGPGNYALFTGGKNFTLASLSGNPESCILDPGVPPAISGPGGRPQERMQDFDRGSTEGRHIVFYQGETPNFRVESITFQHGWCSMFGGAAIAIENSSPTFYDCVFRENLSTGGGAVCLNNSTSMFEGCVFEDNLAMGRGLGGGMGIYKGSAPHIEECIFQRNTAGVGGAVDVYTPEFRPTPLFLDCIFWENEAMETGGAVLVEACEPAFAHCTFDGNMAPIGSSFWCDTNFVIDACIIYGGNSRPFDCDGRGCPTSVSCTDIYGNSEGNWLGDMAGLEGSDGNHALHPQFCNMIYPELEDWTIQEDSSCAPGSEYCYGIRIGARDVNCGNQSTRDLNWSEVKTLY